MKLPVICFFLFLEITLLTAQQGTTKNNPAPVPEKTGGIIYPYFPPFKEIVAAFYKQYKGGTEPEFNFEKRPEGYYIIRLNDAGEPLFEPELFWSAASKTYQPLTVFSRPEPILPGDEERLAESYNPYDLEENIETYLLLHRYEAEQFGLQPYFGYKGWYKDVIQLLDPQSDRLEDDQLNAFARACSAQCDAMLMNLSGMAMPEDMITLNPGSTGLTEIQLGKFKAIHDKGVAAFKKLAERNPAMMTPVGTIHTKYSNEVMDGFMRLLYIQGEKAALKLLAEGLYDDYLRYSARNILTSCPKDAVLIVHGDTDYFTTLYVQVKEGYRKDITIAHSSMLQLPVYYDYLRRGVLDARPLNTNIPEFYFQKMHILSREDAGMETEPVQAVAFFESLTGNKGTDMSQGYQLVSAPMPKLILPAAGGALTLSRQPVDAAEWKTWQSYILFDQLVLLDIIVANQWQRPVCFAMTCAPTVRSNWSNHLALEGVVYRVYPDELPPLSDIKVNTEAGLQLWQQFVFATEAPLTPGDKMPFHFQSLVAGVQLAEALLKEEKKADAARQIHLLEKQFPDEQQAWGYSWYELPEMLAAAGEPAQAELLALQIVQNYKSGRLPAEELKMRDIVFISLSNVTRTYGLEKLKTAIYGK
jgi:hypothetical protein